MVNDEEWRQEMKEGDLLEYEKVPAIIEVNKQLQVLKNRKMEMKQEMILSLNGPNGI